jgi:amino acid transporter
MGSHRQIPGALTKVHPRFHTPYFAIILFCAIAAGLAMSGSIPQMSETYIFAATFTFTMAHFALIGMRIKKPDLARPFKAPWSIRVRARELPITAIVGGLGCLGVWIFILVNNPFGRWFGLIWLVLGAVIFFFYRRHFGLPLNAPAPKPEQTWAKEYVGKPVAAVANGGSTSEATTSVRVPSPSGTPSSGNPSETALEGSGVRARIARLIRRS